jgi:hypothetical protein
MRNWSKIAAWIALLGIVPAHARAQDALTVAVGGRGIGESCVTEIGQKANIFGKHGLKLEIVYTDGGGETQQAVVSNSAQIGVTSGFLGALGLYSKVPQCGSSGPPIREPGRSSRHFRNVELVKPQHAPKDFGRLQRQVNQFDAVGLDCAVAKSLRAVERSTGECEAQSGHG